MRLTRLPFVLFGRPTQALKFPTRTPLQMNFWTKTLLPKHGSFVQFLELSLSDGWLAPFPEDRLGPLYDNTIVLKSSIVPDPRNYDHGPRNLSPLNVAQIFKHCSDVRQLRVTLPADFRSFNDVDYPNGLQTLFVPMVSRLTTLRQLDISNSMRDHFDDTCMNLIVTSLPLLECLVCSHVSRSDDNESTLLGENLSKLQHLSRLSITHSDVIDESWHYCEGPPKLIDLDILGCAHISSVAEAHWIIHKFAPNLQRLGLYFLEKRQAHNEIQENEDTPKNDSGSNKPNIKFHLPALKSLSQSNGHSLDLLLSFVECKSLCSLKITSLPSHGWPVITDLVCTSTWPNLKSLDFKWIRDYDPADWDIVISQFRLRRKCSESGIKLTMPLLFNL